MKPLSVFVAYEREEHHLVATIAAVLGSAMTRRDLDVGRVYRTWAMDIEFLLIPDHGLEDDGGIQFSAYRYQLSMTPLNAAVGATNYEPMFRCIAAYIAERVSIVHCVRTLVVANLQRALESFEPSGA